MTVDFLELSPGRFPVAKFIDDLTDRKAASKIKYRLSLLETFGAQNTQVKGGTIEKAKGYEQYNLWEYKIKYNRQEYRIICYIKNDKCLLVEAFIKQTWKIRLNYLNTAKDRVKDLN